MYKTYLSVLALLCCWSFSHAQAVEIGDIYYSDGTFASSMQTGKKAIGLVYWVSPGKDFGLIMSLEEPSTTQNAYNADVYCEEYYTEGTYAGDWWMPKRIEMLRMGNEQINGKNNNKFTTLNNKLKTVTKSTGGTATALSAASYISSSGYAYSFNPSTGAITAGSTAYNNQSNNNKFRVRCITAF